MIYIYIYIIREPWPTCVYLFEGYMFQDKQITLPKNQKKQHKEQKLCEVLFFLIPDSGRPHNTAAKGRMVLRG